MATFSRTIQRALVDHLLKTSAYTPPTNIQVALFTVAPDVTGAGGTEVSGNAYARVIHNDWNAATDATPAVATNNGDIDFPTPDPAGWGTVVAFALYDNGNMLGFGAISPSKTINAGDTVRFADTDLEVSLN